MPTLDITGLRHRVAGPFTFSISAGECLGLRGPSGAGKTLLLRAIADLDPHEGSARLDGRPAEDFRPSAWRRAVGYLPAESAWWEETVGPHFPDESSPRLDELLASLAFAPDVMRWEIARLSTGERQRLALARLLIRAPRALLLDEPTAALDLENIQRVETLLARYRKDCSAPVLWVGHDAEQLKRVSGRLFQLVAGTLSEIDLRESAVP